MATVPATETMGIDRGTPLVPIAVETKETKYLNMSNLVKLILQDHAGSIIMAISLTQPRIYYRFINADKCIHIYMIIDT